MTKKKVTITQVAQYAGVSVGTVSNYLNGTVSVSPEKAERVQQAVNDLEYTPDALASSLRRKSSKTIYVLTPVSYTHLDVYKRQGRDRACVQFCKRRFHKNRNQHERSKAYG